MRESASARGFSSLWQGIYDFPFRLSNLKAYMIVTLSLIMLAFAIVGFAILTDVVKSSIPEGKELMGVNPYVLSGARYVFTGLVFLTFLSCLAPSGFFTLIIEDTAAGNDEVDWPDNVWYEYISKVAYMLWIFGCCAALSTIFWLLVDLAAPIPGIIWWLVTLASAMMLFPIPLYSTMIAGSPWILLHPQLIVRFLEKPLAALAVYMHVAIFGIPCLGLGLWMILSLSWWAAPVIGVIWATCFLWYARGLGRIGYVLSQDSPTVRRRKKRKKARVRREADD